MLENNQVFPKLCGLSETFKTHMKNKQYPQAKYCYDQAVTIAVFMKLSEKEKITLFGERGERGEIIVEGLFPEKEVQKAYIECIKRGQAYEDKKYEPLQRNGA